MTYKTDNRINEVLLSRELILKIINDLNPNKAHGCDGISIKMIKMCGDSIAIPLMIIFNNALNTWVFPDLWKKGNIVPVHKKESKHLVKNYRPISLLPLFGKIFEKLIFNSLLHYLHRNNLLSENQSGFRSGDSCVSQLILITHEIYKAFDGNPSFETRGIFLDISKASDKVWHKGLLFKLKSYGIEGNLYNIIEDFLHKRKQRVVLNGINSSWEEVNAGVPQGSVLGPLLFLIYINDLPDGLRSNAKLFADDTSLFSVVTDINKSCNDLNSDLSLINDWAFQWKMSFNPDPNKQAAEVTFSRKKNPLGQPDVFFNNFPVNSTHSQKHLGLILDTKLNFDSHLKEKISKANKGIGTIKRLYKNLPRNALLSIYKSFIRPHLDYADIIYDQPHNQSLSDRIESVQYNAALAITGAIRGTSRERLYQELGLESLSNRRWYRRLTMFFNIASGNCPNYLTNILTNLILIFEIQSIFKKSLLGFIRPNSYSIFNINDPKGIKYLTRLRLNFSHLIRQHKFRHNFQDTLNPLCSCSLETESVNHFLLRCHFFVHARKILLDNLVEIIGDISNISESKLVNILLYGNENFNAEINATILKILFLEIAAIVSLCVPIEFSRYP